MTSPEDKVKSEEGGNQKIETPCTDGVVGRIDEGDGVAKRSSLPVTKERVWQWWKRGKEMVKK